MHDEHDDRHHRGPDDRRVGPDEHHEGEQDGDGRRRPDTTGSTAEPPDHHHQAHHHGAVRPGHRGQVGQRRRLHGRLGLRVEAGAVTDRQAAEKRGPRLGQTGRRADEGLASGVGRSEQSAGRLSGRRTPDEEHERGRGSGGVGFEGPGTGHPRASGQHPVVVVTRRHEPDRCPERAQGVGALERRDHGSVTRAQVARQDRVERDGTRAGGESPERLRCTAGLPHGDRDRQQRGQPCCEEHRAGAGRSHPPTTAGHERAPSGQHGGHGSDDESRSRSPDEHGRGDPGRRDRRRHTQVRRARPQL